MTERAGIETSGDTGRRLVPYALAAIAASWFLVFGRLGVLRHERFGTFGFDLAIHDQAIWLLAHGRDPMITIRGIDTFGHHFTPIYWLLAPVSWLGGGPRTLLLLQLASQVLAAVAIYLLAVDLLGRANRWVGVVASTAYLLHPTSGWLAWEFFHPEVFALGPLLMAYRAARRSQWRSFLVWGLIAAATKEDMMLALAMIGLSVILPQPRQRVRGVLVFVAWAAAYLVAARVIGTWRAGGPPPYETYYQPFGDSQFSVLFHFVGHPGDIATVLFDHERLAYYRAMLIPAGLVLPLLGWRGFAIGLPVLFGNVATGPGYPYTHDYRFHYSAIVLAAIAIGAVEGLAQVKRLAERWSPHRAEVWWAVTTALLLLCSLIGYNLWGVGPGSHHYRDGSWPLRDEESTAALLLGTLDTDAYGNTAAKRAAVDSVPDELATSALYNLDAHLAHREGIYEWPNPWIPVNWGLEAGKGYQADPGSVDVIVLEADIAFGVEGSRSQSQIEELELFNALLLHEFKIESRRDGVIVARRVQAAQCFVASGALTARLSPTYRVTDAAKRLPSAPNVCPR